MDTKAELTAHRPIEHGRSHVLIRNSRDGDVPAMLAIYLHHIRRGVDPGVEAASSRRRTPTTSSGAASR